MYLKKKLITDPSGNVVFTVVEESTLLAKEVHKRKEKDGGWNESRTQKMMMSVPPYVYQKFSDELGPECWSDRTFLREFARMRPEFCIG